MGGGYWLEEDRREISWVMEMFHTLIETLVTWLCIFVIFTEFVHSRSMHLICKFYLQKRKRKKTSKEQMKWKRQDIKLEVSDPKGVCLLFGCKGLPRTGHRKLGSRWATNISTVVTGGGIMCVWSQVSCLNQVPSLGHAETAPACGDGLGPGPARSSFQLGRGQYKEDWPQATASW